MKNIKIKHTEDIEKLGLCLFIEVNTLKELIVTRLVSNGVLFDIYEECGTTLGEQIAESEWTLGGASLLLFNNVSGKIKELLSKLIIWGIPNECPVCGCKLERDGEYSAPDPGDGSREVFWEKEYCVNPGCFYDNVLEDNTTNYLED